MWRSTNPNQIARGYRQSVIRQKRATDRASVPENKGLQTERQYQTTRDYRQSVSIREQGTTDRASVSDIKGLQTERQTTRDYRQSVSIRHQGATDRASVSDIKRLQTERQYQRTRDYRQSVSIRHQGATDRASVSDIKGLQTSYYQKFLCCSVCVFKERMRDNLFWKSLFKKCVSFKDLTFTYPPQLRSLGALAIQRHSLRVLHYGMFVTFNGCFHNMKALYRQIK